MHKTLATLRIIFSAVVIALAQNALHAQPNLYGQATSVMLDRSFPSPSVEYLLMDIQTGQTVAMRWKQPETAIPVGSLLKPFVALAYSGADTSQHFSGNQAGANSRQFPVVHCHGKSDGCWHTGGHGSLPLEQALAKSCNAYFLALARDLIETNGNRLERMTAAYGLPAVPASATAPMLIGVTSEWRVPPAALVRAYATLVEQSNDSVVARLLTGMRMAASPGGTAAKIGVQRGGALAKTGTAPCVPIHGSSASQCLVNGDGLVLVLAPAENPRLALLVRQRGTTGAQTAEVAGAMLRVVEEAHASSR
jgi:cell division protein FtsI/penicillin-binding protein 2